MIRTYYDEHVENEWNRINGKFLEFETTYHFITSTISKRSRILDLGSGPGRYAFRLAQDGYAVHLADLSANNIDFAKTYADEHSIPILGADVADATDLGLYKDNSFDVILCLGPFYHLETQEDRNRCIRELYRVVKNGGYIFCAFIMNYAPVYDFLKRIPESIADTEQTLLDWYTKGYMEHDKNTGTFYISYFAEQEEIDTLFEASHFKKEYMFGCEGILNLRWDSLSAMDESIKNKWLTLSYVFSKTAAGINSSEHVVYVGRKPYTEGEAHALTV
jgi:Methylase involved in ubiquinone/menaquinone biosynthesis